MAPILSVFNDASIVAHHLKFDLKRECVLTFTNFIVDVTHDGDYHVEECDLGEESSDHEEYVDEDRVIVPRKIVQSIERAESKQVLVDDRVEDPHFSDIGLNSVFIAPVLVQYEERGSNRHD